VKYLDVLSVNCLFLAFFSFIIRWLSFFQNLWTSSNFASRLNSKSTLFQIYWMSFDIVYKIFPHKVIYFYTVNHVILLFESIWMEDCVKTLFSFSEFLVFPRFLYRTNVGLFFYPLKYLTHLNSNSSFVRKYFKFYCYS
jgi:hypothetical protein